MKITYPDYTVELARCGGGFPTKITQHLRNGRNADLVHTAAPWLTVTLADGRVAVPQLPDEYLPLSRRDDDDTAHLMFNNIPFFADGQSVGNWRLSMDYEFLKSGTAFISMRFQALDQDKPALSSFRLRVPMDFGYEDDVTYGYWPRPDIVEPTGILSVPDFVKGRGHRDKVTKTFDWTLPLASFDFGREGRPSRHVEWLMEDQIALDGGFRNVSTTILWENGSPIVEYEFAAGGVTPGPMPYYWRGKFGFTLGQTPKIRDKAPLRLFHCIDAFDNIPSIDRVRQMAAEGADAIALHDSCWRIDTRNGGNPHEQQAYLDLIAECHRHGIRVLPYIRGSEDTAVEDQCSWFKYDLTRDFDGFYSDYGSAFSFHEVNGACPAGRIGFKEHYRVYQRIREQTIGKGGVFIAHTGPSLSGAVIAELTDSYLSGEGERGAMLRSRRENAYFSGTTVAPGSLWTAEFPEYRSQQMLAYLANTGQFPHVTFGAQRKSASIAHPQEPGCVTFARPLWRLYGLMAGERQLRFDNDLCDESIECDSYDTGLSVFTMQDGSRLYFLSNFQNAPRHCSANRTLSCAAGEKCYRLDVSQDSCTAVPLASGAAVEADLPEYGICGFVVCPVNEKWAARLTEFGAPYPDPFPAVRAYEQLLVDAEKARHADAPAKTLYMKVDVPYFPGTLELEFLRECYENTNELFATDEAGNTRRLGYLSKLGLTDTEPPISECMWPGESADWIALHDLLPSGRWHLEVYCTQGGCGVTQRYHILLSETKDPENARDITYYLGIDTEKSRLGFDIWKG